MFLRSVISGGLLIVSCAALIWANQLQIATSAVSSQFAFTDIKVLEAATNTTQNAESDALEAYSRPLFAPNRRPFQAMQEIIPEEEPAPPAMEEEEPPIVEVDRPRLRLLGTVPAAQEPSALIAVEESGANSWFRKGDMIGGWRISRIGTDDIELSSEGDGSVSFKISLYPESQ